MQKKRDRDNRRRVLQGSYPYVSKNPPQIQCVRNNEVFKGKESLMLFENMLI